MIGKEKTINGMAFMYAHPTVRNAANKHFDGVYLILTCLKSCVLKLKPNV